MLSLWLALALAVTAGTIAPMDGVGGIGGKPAPPPVIVTPAPQSTPTPNVIHSSTVTPMDGVGGIGGKNPPPQSPATPQP